MIEYMQNMLAWGGIPGGWEWLIILVVALLIFGRRLPELARSLGKSLTEFKKGVREAQETKDELVSDVRKAKDEVVDEAKDAAGLNELDEND
jgi:sec-independent protein translocase protein TatA